MEWVDVYSTYGDFSSKKIFTKLFSDIPRTREFNSFKGKDIVCKIKEHFGSRLNELTYTDYINSNNKNPEFEWSNSIFSIPDEELLLVVGKTYTTLFYKNAGDGFDTISDIIAQHKIINNESNISIITSSPHGLGLQSIPVNDIKLDIDKCYNDDFKEIDATIKERLNKDNDKGVILLYGKPGTGKTTYIRHLINSVSKKIIFVPPALATQITEPSFVTFLLNYPNSILVIEDSETIIVDRNISKNSSVSNLLNISDGLLSDVLNIQLVCTFNADISSIDKALLRKGRIIAKYDFTELCIDKCNIINKELGFEHEITEPMVLADLYNQEARSFSTPKKTKIGF